MIEPRRLDDCRKCDGCGWYEGGPTIVTWCEDCNRSGVLIDGRAPTDEEKQQLLEQGILHIHKL